MKSIKHKPWNRHAPFMPSNDDYHVYGDKFYMLNSDPREIVNNIIERMMEKGK